MVKTRRSHGENGDVDEGNEILHDVGNISDEKASTWTPRELRSSQYKVSRTIERWPTRYRSRRLREALEMSRLVFPESDTEPEKYIATKRSDRMRKVRVFFTEDNEPGNHSVTIHRRGNRKTSLVECEDKPIQQNVRRSCRKRKLLHHNFNESWITNELKVKGYPDLYGYPGFSSSDEFTSGDEARVSRKKVTTRIPPPTNTDEDTQMSRRRTSARFTNKKVLNFHDTSQEDSDSEEDNNQTVIEKKPPVETKKIEEEKMEADPEPDKDDKEEEVEKKAKPTAEQDSESNQGPARSTRGRGGRPRRQKKDNQGIASSDTSSESGSEITLTRQPRRSKRTRTARPTSFVQIAQRETRGRAKTYTIRKKPYSLRERKPMLRRKTIRSQSPCDSSSSSSSGSDTEDLNVSMKNKSKGRQKSKALSDEKKQDRALRDIQPVEVDGSVRFTSVGGLEEQIQCLREMVLFPLMYPDLFAKFKTRPAKGVLFHGPPGTGKTLLARALANECSLIGGRKVAFFVRKGADCLKKWVGESERNLKLLFQQANKMKPSIIFFDEIDALAPVRSVRQDQVHTSVVGTLLAEMDGLCDRGEVIIIGATNRVDAVDPALRRPGRFDRELHFPAPPAPARRDILHIYTRDWHSPPGEHTLRELAEATAGYGGSDLKALCSEAVLKALRRVYPQVYESEHALVIDAKNVEVTKEDLLSAMSGMVSGWSRAAPPSARPLPPPLSPLLSAQLAAAQQLLDNVFPQFEKTSVEWRPATLLVSGAGGGTGVGAGGGGLLGAALASRLERCAVRDLSLAALHAPHHHSPEHALISLFSECRRAERGCVIFVRDIEVVWHALSSSGSGAGALLLQLWRTRAAGDRALLLATSNATHDTLPHELQDLFPVYKDCVYRVREPNASEVIAFLKPIITEVPLQPPVVEDKEPPPPLPRAPPPPPPRETAEEMARRKRKEDYKLRELRIFLRDICRKLASNRRFYKFTKPVDLEEVTDYLDIIKQPMDLETMMTKVDMHKYNCAKEFLDDIDLICANALEYNPDRTSSDKQIRHEACSLRDHAHALIDVEMDSDFEVECQAIANKRRKEGDQDNDLPDFIYTASNLPQALDTTANDSKAARTPNGEKSESHSAKRKRKRINAWSKGLVAKRSKTTPKICKETSMVVTDEESKENKPITSTPLPNGSGLVTSSSGSDDDAPLRRPQDDSMFNISSQTVVNNHVLDSPAKSTEKSPTKASPKKRNSGHDISNDSDKVLINKTELDNLLYKNAKALRGIGLEALLDLHDQLSKAVHSYANTRDRTRLPQDLHAIISRYVQCAKK